MNDYLHYKKVVVNTMKKISTQVKDLDVLLFGPKPEKWWLRMNLLMHLKNIMQIIVKGRANLWLIKNVIKANVLIGMLNIYRLLFIQLHVVDEMDKINKNKRRVGLKK